MKTRKLFFIMSLVFTLACVQSSITYAQTKSSPTPTENTDTSLTPTDSTKNKQIEDLKSRLATKVAELRQTTKRAFFGTVKSKTVSTITIETKTKDLKMELTDDIKIMQYIKGAKTTLTHEDLEKGDIVTVFGDYDATLDLLNATYIFVETTNETVRTSGTITAMDEKAFTFKLSAADGAIYTINYEKTTKGTRWTKDGDFEKIGFSSLNEGETIFLVATKVPKKEEELSGIRVLSLGNLTGAKATPTPEPDKNATPSATPEESPKTTTKVTPKPTAKVTPKATATP